MITLSLYTLQIACIYGKVHVLQSMDPVVRELEAPMHCLITTNKSLNDPRVVPIDKIIDTSEKQIVIWGFIDYNVDTDHFRLKGPPACIRKVFSNSRAKAKFGIPDDDPAEAAQKMVEKPKELNII